MRVGDKASTIWAPSMKRYTKPPGVRPRSHTASGVWRREWRRLRQWRRRKMCGVIS
jgi:hypothetical protein